MHYRSLRPTAVANRKSPSRQEGPTWPLVVAAAAARYHPTSQTSLCKTLESRVMFTVTKDLLLPSTTTGSFPRPRWFDESMWGKPLDTCMLDVRFREKFQDALAVVISDQERAGLDLLTTRRFPLRRRPCRAILAPLSHPALGGAGRRLPSGRGDPQRVAPLSARHALERNLHRLALAPRGRQDRAPAAGLSQDLADGPGPREAAGEVRHLLLAGYDALSGHRTRPSTRTSGKSSGTWPWP